jgi:hypothetical protein
MIKADWYQFRAKFSENPQANFEWFCYLLFCREYNKRFGIFRFKNQAGIETNPITQDGELIGWQAKHYETTLSDHKDDLLKALTKSKKDYPGLTKLIYYTNQEWGQGKKQIDPQAKIDIENKAKEMQVKIDWRTSSYFESTFVSVENEIIARHFFSSGKSILDLLIEKEKHSENVLYEIQTNITFGDHKIEIDRQDLLKKLQEELKQKQVVVLSGVAGVGKTAVIKNLKQTLNNDVPFYVFKASELNISNINTIFEGFTLQDFIATHSDEENRIIVIDSAEKLLDQKNTDPFKEFLSALIKNNWKIIFTTRNNYLEDLNYQFIEIYQISPGNLDIQNLGVKELTEISQAYNFKLPEDSRLLELIKNPFYLNEYLKLYEEGEQIDYVKFKVKLWNKIIKKAKPAREQCFVQIAFQRANEGQFFVTPACESEILNELVNDGILGYETAGYFITHDIYEEWALEKRIQTEFIKNTKNSDLFKAIGESLPIRRSFRNWVSEKLLLNDDSVKRFIEEIVGEDEIELFWKDEILVSILLSDYSAVFFESFSEKLLQNNQALLKRQTFLLRLACKEVDNDFFKKLGVIDLNIFSIKYVFTKPKGSGWQSIVKFVYDNLDKIGIENTYFILPIIHDWNSKIKEGETTRLSSLIALKYYQWLIQKDAYYSKEDDVKLYQTILYGASEIKDELKTVFDQILNNKWKEHRNPYCDLIKHILTKLGDNIKVIKVLPGYILKLADLFWFQIPDKTDPYSRSHMNIEEEFCIEPDHLDYFPASAYQTPIYWLLKVSLRQTVDFILDFTNKTVECFAKSEFAKNEVEEIEVFVEAEKPVKQYICNRLWNTYRGTQVSTCLLESMHMALEKHFLEVGENADSRTLENWLLYLVKNSKSASITAVVTSIVLAYPEKSFNVARILFQTKEFFLFDTSRMMLDQTVKSHYSMGYGLNYDKKVFQDERIATCDDKHRQSSLEHQALNYQFFRSGEVSEEAAKARQQIIWSIFDKYYSELPDKSKETENDKTWRLFLARMDRRKMKPTIDKKDGQVLINLNPEIDQDLKEFSETALKKSSESFKHTALNLWSSYKIRNEQEYKKYEQYENNPRLALEEVKEIVAKLITIDKPDIFKSPHSEAETFYMFHYSIPAHVCSILMRDFPDSLSTEEKIFCKDIIIEVATSSLRPNYRYQIFDGVESAISVLPLLLAEFPDESEIIKTTLLLTLFDSYPIGMYGPFSDYPTKAILNNLWKISFKDAQSIVFGYLLLKPKYEELRDKMRKENYKKNIYELDKHGILAEFLEENENDLKKIIENKISLVDLNNIEQINLDILNTAFKLIPLKTTDAEHKEVVLSIISAFAKVLFSREREDRIDYAVRQCFMEKLAYFVLSSSGQDIPDYLKPLIDNFRSSEAMADLFQEIISAEDYLDAYDNFWQVWNIFYKKVIELCKDGDGYWYTDKIVKSYLFAQNPWKETAKYWHTLKDSNVKFFGEIAKTIGHCPSVLYSIAKLLTGIGNEYLDSGITWISKMLNDNKNLWTDKLEPNTIYYLENLTRKYIYNNREKIRRTNKLKKEVLVILEFLVDKGSVVGYMLRENIL